MHEFLAMNAAFAEPTTTRRTVRRTMRAPRPGSFSERAKVAMIHAGLSVKDVAQRVECARVTASEAINHGLHWPTRCRIAELLGIEP